MAIPNQTEAAIWMLLRDQCPAMWLGLPIGAGDVYFVDMPPNGDDGNIGTRPDQPFLTIEHAIGECADDHNDYIIVLDCWQEDTFPVSINKRRVHIIGLDVENGKYPRMNAPTDTAIFTLDADYCEIAGLSLNAGVSHGAIEWTGYHGRGAIRRCWFGETGGGLYGIYDPAPHDAAEMLIEDCRFGNGLTSDGIRIAHNMTRGIIRNNLFRPQAIGINVTANMKLGWILSNRFVCFEDGNGAAITLTNSDDIFIDDNRANRGKAHWGANNPYVDGGTNHWGNNYQDILAVLP